MQAYLELVAGGQIDVARLIDRVVTVDEAPAAYEQLAKADGALPLGVVIHYPDEEEAGNVDAASITIGGYREAGPSRINYALVGAGAFGTAMLVPQMRKRQDRYFLRGVVSRSAQGSNFARDNQVEVLASDIDVVLRDSGFQLVVIATRHNEHADQVARSLAAGKHVFVEKPLAISWNELDRVVETYERMEGAAPLLMVGFNRRFSPALQEVKRRLEARRAPLVIQYRLNAGYIALDHWVHGSQGGGRNIGEACNMYDVFRFLAGAPVRSIDAAAIDPGALPYARSDNFAVTIAYEDGTLASLVYTALGPKAGLGKEHITVFADGEAFIVDDFKKLTKASDGTVLWQSSEADKGHFEEVSRLGDAIATGGPAPIPFHELVETTAVALSVDDLIHGRI